MTGATSILTPLWWVTCGRAPAEARVVLRPKPSRFKDGDPDQHKRGVNTRTAPRSIYHQKECCGTKLGNIRSLHDQVQAYDSIPSQLGASCLQVTALQCRSGHQNAKRAA